MNKTLEVLLNKYGAEFIISKILGQLKIMASTEEAVRVVAKELLDSSGCDTEYIYSLCEYTNTVTYVSDEDEVSDEPWNDISLKEKI